MSKFHGEFLIWMPIKTEKLLRDGLSKTPDLIISNRVTDKGEEHYLKGIFQNVFPIAGGANFKVGLCNQSPADDDTLSSITTEPTTTNGYARQTLARNATGFPTFETVNGHNRIVSAEITFTASGGDFSTSFSRAFLTDDTDLFAYGGALSAPILLTDGNSFAMKYASFLD